MIKMSTPPVNHSPRTTAIPPLSTQKIAARNAAPQAIRMATIATTPHRAGVNPGGAPHDGRTRSGPLVGLEPIACPRGCERRRHHRAFHSELLESTRNPKPARTRLIAGPQRDPLPVCLTQPRDEFCQRMQIIADLPIVAHSPPESLCGHRFGNRSAVDIQTKIKLVFHT